MNELEHLFALVCREPDDDSHRERYAMASKWETHTASSSRANCCARYNGASDVRALMLRRGGNETSPIVW